MSDRLSLEVSFDAGVLPFSVSRSSHGAIDDASTSWARAFTGLFAFQPTLFHEGSATSVVTIRHGGLPVVAASALTWELSAGGRTRPFLTIGGGVQGVLGGPATISIDGHYAFTFGSLGPLSVTTQTYPVPIDESDHVTIRLSERPAPVGLVGVGFTRERSARSGFRVEARCWIGASRSRTTLSAAPSHVVGQPGGALTYQAGSSTALQFSTVPDVQSTLSGPAIVEFQTFQGSGLRVQASASVGYFVRF